MPRERTTLQRMRKRDTTHNFEIKSVAVLLTSPC